MGYVKEYYFFCNRYSASGIFGYITISRSLAVVQWLTEMFLILKHNIVEEYKLGCVNVQKSVVWLFLTAIMNVNMYNAFGEHHHQQQQQQE